MGTDLFVGPREKKAIEFAFKIGVNKSDNPAGYEWYMEPLLTAAEADPLAALEAKLSLEALPAPAPAVETGGVVGNTKRGKVAAE
jgi:hypothetical protein